MSSKVETHPPNIPALAKSPHRKFSPLFKLAFGEMEGGAAGGSQDSTGPHCAVTGSAPSAPVGSARTSHKNPF